MIYFLFLLLLLMLIIVFLIYSNDIITPSFLFIASFCGASLWAVLYANEWRLGLHLNTFLVIFLGTLIFAVTCFIVHKLFSLFQKKKDVLADWQPENIAISRYKLILFIIFEVFTIMYSIYTVVHLVGGSMSNFTASVVQYRNMNMFFGEQLVLPRIVNYSRTIVNAGGYWFGYIMINNYFVSRKVDKTLFLIVILSGISSYVLGGRNGLVNIFFAVICSYFIISNKKKAFRNNVHGSTILKLLVLIVILLASFESLALLIGRSGFDGATGLDYLAVYIGAPIKNLDLFLQEYTGNLPFKQNQTFVYLINWLGPKLNLITSSYTLDLPYRTVDNVILGNVYTTFYSYIYDYGYFGVAILVPIMGVISQSFYEFLAKSKIVKFPPMSSLVYTYISSLLVMSFFSNKFYEQFFNVTLLQTIIVWWLFKFIFVKYNNNIN